MWWRSHWTEKQCGVVYCELTLTIFEVLAYVERRALFEVLPGFGQRASRASLADTWNVSRHKIRRAAEIGERREKRRVEMGEIRKRRLTEEIG